MTVPTVHQLYCTHCTYATSYLHQRGDEAVGQQVFEYSTRSGSVAREHSHDYFRQIEPYMYYHLPSDLPAADATKHDADTTSHWRRLLYMPSVGGLRIVAQVAYRTTDTKGRPGSYFSHVLCSENNDGQEPDWTAVDALRLWGSDGWVDTDQADLPFQLPTFNHIAELNGSTEPIINDELLLSFLRQPASAHVPSIDVRGTVPIRFWQKTPQQRQQLLSDTLTGFLDLNLERRQTMLLAVEPSLAALIFYGVARLLPRTGIGEWLSFSTLEGIEDRPQTTLAATTFYQPQHGRLPSEASHNRGFAINTFQDDDSAIDRSTPCADYAKAIVERLVNYGFADTDAFIHDMESMQTTDTSDLVEMLQSVTLADRAMIAAETPKFQQDLRSIPSERAARKLCQEVGQKLVKLREQSSSSRDKVTTQSTSNGSSQRETSFQELAQNPDRSLAIVRLFNQQTEVSKEVQDVIRLLLIDVIQKNPERLTEVLESQEIPIAIRVALLERAIRKANQIPADCPGLWSPSHRANQQPLFAELLSRQPIDQCRKYLALLLQKAMTREEVEVVCSALSKKGTDESNRLLVWFVDQIVLAASNQPESTKSLLVAIRESKSIRQCVFEVYADRVANEQREDLSPLGAALASRLNELPEERRFDKTLELLIDANPLLNTELNARVVGWQGVRKALEEIDQLQSRQGTVERLKSLARRSQRSEQLNQASHELVCHARYAMPDSEFEDDPDGSHRTAAVLLVSDRVLQQKPLPANVVSRIRKGFTKDGQDEPFPRVTQPHANSTERLQDKLTAIKNPLVIGSLVMIGVVGVLVVMFRPVVPEDAESPVAPVDVMAKQTSAHDNVDPQESHSQQIPSQSKNLTQSEVESQTALEPVLLVANQDASHTTDAVGTPKAIENTNSPTAVGSSEDQGTTSDDTRAATSVEGGKGSPPESEPVSVLQLSKDQKETDGRKLYYLSLPKGSDEWTPFAKLPAGQAFRRLTLHLADEKVLEVDQKHNETLLVSAHAGAPIVAEDADNTVSLGFRWNRETNALECRWQDVGELAANDALERMFLASLLQVDCGRDQYFLSFLGPIKAKEPLRLAGRLPIEEPLIHTLLPSVRVPIGDDEQQSIIEPSRREHPRIEDFIQLPDVEQSRVGLLHDLYHAVHCINWTLRKSNLLALENQGVLDSVAKQLQKQTKVLRTVASGIQSPGELTHDPRSYLDVEWLLPSDGSGRDVDTRRFPLVPGRDDVRLIPAELAVQVSSKEKIVFTGRAPSGSSGRTYRYYVRYPDTLDQSDADRVYELQFYSKQPKLQALRGDVNSEVASSKLYCRMRVRFRKSASGPKLSERCAKLSDLLWKFSADINLISNDGRDKLQSAASYFRDDPDKHSLTWQTDLYDVVRDEILATADEIYHLSYEPYASEVRQTLGVTPHFSGTLYQVIGGEVQEEARLVKGGILVEAIQAP